MSDDTPRYSVQPFSLADTQAYLLAVAASMEEMARNGKANDSRLHAAEDKAREVSRRTGEGEETEVVVLPFAAAMEEAKRLGMKTSYHHAQLSVVQTNVLSTADEYALPLRWVALMSGRAACDLVASTGIQDGAAVIKQILAGAQAVQVVSGLYRNGLAHLQTMAEQLQDWMIQNEYYALDQFRGSMSQAKAQDPAVYERFQFMKHFGGLS